MLGFIFRIQSKSDVITNSSSELFVFKNNSVESIIELLHKIYPDWRNEYKPPRTGKDLEKWELDYIRDLISPAPYYFAYSKMMKTIFESGKRTESLEECNLSKILCLTVQETYKNWNTWDPIDGSWSNKILKLSDLAYDKLRNYCESHGFVLLFSLYENPDYKYQEILENYADRIHL